MIIHVHVNGSYEMKHACINVVQACYYKNFQYKNLSYNTSNAKSTAVSSSSSHAVRAMHMYMYMYNIQVCSYK